MLAVLNRLASLEEQFKRMKIRPPASTSSSDAEMTYEATQLAPVSQYRTPQNRVANARNSLALAPAASIKTAKAAAKAFPISTAPKTPPPGTRNLPWDANSTPSPIRPSTTRRTVGLAKVGMPDATTSAGINNNMSFTSEDVFRSSTAYNPPNLIRGASKSDLGEPTVQKRSRRETGGDDSQGPPLGSEAPEREWSKTPERRETAPSHYPPEKLPILLIAAPQTPTPITHPGSAPASLTRPPVALPRGAGSSRRSSQRNARRSRPYPKFDGEAEAEARGSTVEEESSNEIDEHDEDNGEDNHEGLMDNNSNDKIDSDDDDDDDEKEEDDGGPYEDDEDENIVLKKETTPANQRKNKGGMRSIFGVTPDASKPPPPLQFKGTLPILKLGDPSTSIQSASTSHFHSHSRSHSVPYGPPQPYARSTASVSAAAFTATPGPSTSAHTLDYIRETDKTPTRTPGREPQRNPTETPPASLTLFGTEILGTALKEKFSDDLSTWRS
jgi:hypothetical protein